MALSYLDNATLPYGPSHEAVEFLRPEGATVATRGDVGPKAVVFRQGDGAPADRENDADPARVGSGRRDPAGVLRPDTGFGTGGGVVGRQRCAGLDIGSILAILRDHADTTPERLLFLWNLFEGVPKFYRDCHEQEVLAADRPTLLRRIFFESSSPLRTEADNWFLRELRGRYDVVLKFVARNPGRMHNELVNAIREASGDPTTQIGGYLKVLIERFRLIEKKLPVFAKPEAKRSRYYVTDNFLRSWLAALANPVSAIAFRPVLLRHERSAHSMGWVPTPAGLSGR